MKISWHFLRIFVRILFLGEGARGMGVRTAGAFGFTMLPLGMKIAIEYMGQEYQGESNAIIYSVLLFLCWRGVKPAMNN